MQKASQPPEQQTRDLGVDLFKTLCCLGVLIYHVAQYNLQNPVSYTLYFLASYSVPGFFLINGYLLFGHMHVSIQYLEEKTKNLFLVSALWCFFLVIIQFLITGTLVNPMDTLINSLFLGKGVAPVMWFLGTLLIIQILFAYPLYRLFQKNQKLFAILVMFSLFIVSTLKTWGSFGADLAWLYPRGGQTFWLFLYAPIYAAGGLMRLIVSKIKTLPQKSALLWAAALFSGAIFVIFSSKSSTTYTTVLPSNYYGTPPHLLWLILLATACLSTKINTPSVEKAVQFAGRNLFTVYMLHLPILTSIYAAFLPRNSIEVCLLIIIVFFVCILAGELFKKLPVFRIMAR